MDYLDKPDGKLCESLFKGDSKAFELIYNKYFKYLYRYVNHSLGSKEDSEEILHDLFLSIWQNRSNKKILDLRGGPSATVLNAINLVRKRAELPALEGLSKDQLREAIWRERFYELSFENKTWYDMVRLRKAFNVSTKKFDAYVGHKFSYGPTLSEKELLFPIPTAEIRNNNKLKQNKGY